MCNRSMEQHHIDPAADERGTASDAGPVEQEERAETSGGAVDASRRPLAPSWEAEKNNKNKKSAGELSRRPAAAAEESARERLKRHRTEMVGRVRIPDMWGQERLLNDWVVDCAVFDRPLAATRGLLTARDALVAECAAARRTPHGHAATTRPLRVQNGCS
ncbi:protein BIC1 [Lolium perenne]|uniref:protein BIC1 n=1 Tax=Lolium perenne TaxID=4522 RepID=UPI0021F673AF|nr:protein BIC1-like [Lolium perenne]